MKKIIFTLIVLSYITLKAQIVTIPDANFKAALRAAPNNVDLNSDGQIQVSEALLVDTIIVNNKSIINLTGIDAFTALKYLNCFTNQITSLDVSKNTLLTDLILDDNQLTTLDVSKNTALIDLRFSTNQLTAIDVSKNTLLKRMDCSGNYLTTLNVTKNTALTELYCDYNQNLFVVCVNSTQLGLTSSTPDNWRKNASTSWSTSCASFINETDNLKIVPVLIHTYNLMGQEITPEQVKEGVYIYQYNDGSIKKICKIDSGK